MKRCYFILLFFCTITFAQNNTLHTIYTGADGIQTSMHLKNTGSLFQVTDKENYKIQNDENGILKSNLCVSGDFDGDGVSESALLYDYTYIPNGKPKFMGSKIVIYSELNQSIVPTGVWFSKLKTDFNFDEIKFASAGDFNGDGKSDIALFRYTEDVHDMILWVLFSNGNSFEEPVIFYANVKDEFNFCTLKFVAAGNYMGDYKTDLAVFYDYYGETDNTLQKIFIFEATEKGFNDPVAIFSDTKSNFDFENGIAALAGDYNGDGHDDFAFIKNDEKNDLQSIEVFENQNNTSFLKKTYLTPLRKDFNFAHVKFAASGLMNDDTKTDILLCYNHVGFRKQIMFVFESTGESFSPYKNYFEALNATLSFDNLNALFVGNYSTQSKVTPTLWYNNHKGAVTFGFDDGLTNALRYGANELTKNGLNGTFYIISNIPFNNEPDYCNWDTLRYYKNRGHEIGSHTANHKFSGNYTGTDSLQILRNLLYKSKDDLDTQLDQNTLSMSYPFGSFNPQTPIEVSNYFQTGRSSQDGYNLPTPFDWHVLKSKYVSSTTSNDIIKSWLLNAEAFKYHLSLMYHNIQNKAFNKSDEYSFALFDFKQNINDALHADLWIESQGNIYKYIQERNALKVLSYKQYDDSVCFVADDFLDNNLYNQPLTLQVEIPANLCNDSAYTNISTKRIPVFSLNGRKYCYINTIPDNKQICISKSKIISANKNLFFENKATLKCYRTDNKNILLENLSENTGFIQVKIITLNGVVLYQKNITSASKTNLEVPYSQQLKYIIISDEKNNLVAKRLIF